MKNIQRCLSHPCRTLVFGAAVIAGASLAPVRAQSAPGGADRPPEPVTVPVPAPTPSPAPAAVRPAPRTPYLGVVLGNVDEALRAQLGLPEGAGLLVRAALAGSPAAQAGVMQHDVIHHFNDQLLVNEEQFETLVRQAGPGAEVKLSLFRKGKSEVVQVKLGDQVAAARPAGEGRDHLIPVGPSGAPQPLAVAPDGKPIQVPPFNGESFEQELREFREKMKQYQGNSQAMQKEIEKFRTRLQENVNKRKDEIAKANGAGDPKVQVMVTENGGGAATSTVTSTSGQGGSTVITVNNSVRTKWQDDKGSAELVIENGRKTLTATDAAGKQIFSGPVDTAEQRAKLPAQVREQLERLEQGVKVNIQP